MTLRYILEAIICSGLFLVLYRWILAKNVSFRLCRVYLMVTMLLAVAIPLMEVPLYPSERMDAFNEWTVFSFDDFAMPSADADEASAAGQIVETNAAKGAESSAEKTARAFDLKLVLMILYSLTVAASLTLLAYSTARIHRLRSRSQLTHEKDYILAEHEDIKTPFSFVRTIFVGFNYEPQERRQIITHEASHVRHGHSYERLFMSVLRSVFWFNPFFWMAEKDLEEVQEWEADKDVLNEGWNLKTYRTTIFKQLFGYNPDITCGLNHSLTKQRFIMMTQSHRGKGAWLRLAATIPVIAATFFAFGCGTRQAEMTDNVSTDLTNGTEATYIDMCPPCDAVVSNAFNADKAGRSHSGIDYVLDEGAPVYAAADGEVSAVTRDDSNGLMLVLKHADGFETRYAHLSKVEIMSRIGLEGPKIKCDNTYMFSTDENCSDWTITGKIYKGQQIGYAGSTGRSTGPHLHFEVRLNGSPVDPAPFFTSDKPVKGPFLINVSRIACASGTEYVIFCNGKQTDKDKVGDAVREFFSDQENMYSATVHIMADDDIPMGVLTDIKLQLRSVRALKLRYETDDGSIDRRLPPAQSGSTSVRTDIPDSIERRNIIFVKVNPAGEMLLGANCLKGSLRDEELYRKEIERLKGYISNPAEDDAFPEVEVKDILMPDGSSKQLKVSRAMIIYQDDRGTSYEAYTKAMRLISTAYKELREEVSSEIFGKSLAELSDAEMQVIYQAVPMNVSEAEQKDVVRK